VTLSVPDITWLAKVTEPLGIGNVLNPYDREHAVHPNTVVQKLPDMVSAIVSTKSYGSRPSICRTWAPASRCQSTCASSKKLVKSDPTREMNSTASGATKTDSVPVYGQRCDRDRRRFSQVYVTVGLPLCKYPSGHPEQGVQSKLPTRVAIVQSLYELYKIEIEVVVRLHARSVSTSLRTLLRIASLDLSITHRILH